MQLKRPRRAKNSTATQSVSQSLMAAALALPGLVTSATANAATAPEEASISYKHLYYQDYQRSGKRMTINADYLRFEIPVKNAIGIEGSLVADSISGASPQFHSTLSGASGRGITEYRRGADAKVTGFFERGTAGIGASFSTEKDWESKTLSVDGRISSANNNTTLAFGADYTRDEIGKEFEPDFQKRRDTAGVFIGVTQVLTPNDLVQSNITFNDGQGFFSDQYKDEDNRPEHRKQLAWLTRYAHYFSAADIALHTSYRYYRNDWGVRAHSVDLQLYKQFESGWMIRPNIRYYTQRAAEFYGDPPFPPSLVGTFFSADHRLSGFGAITLSLKISKELPKNFSLDAKWEWYQQRSDWRLGGNGSIGLEHMTARWGMIGISKKF